MTAAELEKPPSVAVAGAVSEHEAKHNDSQTMPEAAPDVNSFIDRMEAASATFQAECDPVQEGDTPKQYAFKSASDILNEPRLQYIVRGLLPDAGLCAVYGAPGAGKSFFIIHLAACIAEGEPFFERNTTQRKVYLFCLEGSGGLRGRLEAWQRENARSYPAQVSFYTDALDLIDEATECAPQLEQGSVVIIDTLNAAAPAMDENSSKDMGRAIEAAKMIQRTAQATVILVHHCGKDYQKGLRGHSSLNAALDCAIELTRKADDVRTWRIQKSKDGVDGTARDFMLKSVLLHVTESGHEITSCVIDESVETIVREKPLTTSQAYALETLVQCLAKEGTESVHLEAWRPLFYAGMATANPKTKNQAFNRGIKELVSLKKAYVCNDYYSLTPIATTTTQRDIVATCSQAKTNIDRYTTLHPSLEGVACSGMDGGYEYE